MAAGEAKGMVPARGRGEESGAVPKAPPRVLIADDYEVNRRLLIEVFRGDAYPPLSLGADVRWRVPNEMGFQAVQAATYAILVGGEYASTGHIVLNLVYTPPPSNDDFTNALALAGDSLEVRGSVIGATAEPGEANLLLQGVRNARGFRRAGKLLRLFHALQILAELVQTHLKFLAEGGQKAALEQLLSLGHARGTVFADSHAARIVH